MQKNLKASESVSFFPDEKKALAREDKTILEVALENNIDIPHSCGGNGSCGTCLVVIESDQRLPARSPLEEDMAQDRSFSDSERLACQTHCQAGYRINIPN